MNGGSSAVGAGDERRSELLMDGYLVKGEE